MPVKQIQFTTEMENFFKEKITEMIATKSEREVLSFRKYFRSLRTNMLTRSPEGLFVLEVIDVKYKGSMTPTGFTKTMKKSFIHRLASELDKILLKEGFQLQETSIGEQ
jgi:hypothetical protein